MKVSSLNLNVEVSRVCLWGIKRRLFHKSRSRMLVLSYLLVEDLDYRTSWGIDRMSVPY